MAVVHDGEALLMLSAKIEPIDRDIAVLVSEELSPEARSRFLAEYAEEQIAEVRMHNAQVIGQVPDYETIVDGRRGAMLTSVRPNGTIVAEYDLLLEVFAWIGAQLVTHSPRRSGRYAASHAFFADGIEVDPKVGVPDASEYVFVNLQPYARKIEAGLSAMAPDGVYQAVTAVANRRFGNIARILFGYRDVGTRGVRTVRVNDNRGTVERRARGAASGRNPAIIIRLGR
ncbi:MAG TPA: hypothetical protein VFE52_04175 [Devosia sp.]|jgi:hypothetical protein|nr:hypothetical protein [Devosia sp.]